MNMLISISWRNVWRNRKRSIILMIAVILGISTGLFVLAFYNGLIKQRLDNALNTEVSHIQIHTKEFKSEQDIKEIIPHGMQVLTSVQQSSLVHHATGRLLIQGMLASSNGSKGVILNGVMPDEEQRVTRLKDKVAKGTYFSSESSNEIIISEVLAATLKVNINSKIVLTFQDTHNELISSAYRIIGLYKTSNGPYDEMNAFLPLQSIGESAGIKDDIHEIAILLKNPEELYLPLNELRSLHSSLLIEDWKTISPELGITISFGDQMVYVYMGIILLALAFGIINTMMMSVLERTREIGMLAALGMNKVRLFIMILLETTFLIFAGCPLGLLLAAIIIFITNKTGIELAMLKATASNFGYDPIVHPIMRMHDVQITVMLIIITAIVSALLPAKKAISLIPVESIKQ